MISAMSKRGAKINPREHVYCSNCARLKMVSDTDGHISPMCRYESKCFFYDPQESAPYWMRPYYAAELTKTSTKTSKKR